MDLEQRRQGGSDHNSPPTAKSILWRMLFTTTAGETLSFDKVGCNVQSPFAKNGLDPAKNKSWGMYAIAGILWRLPSRDRGLVKGLGMESGDKGGVDKKLWLLQKSPSYLHRYVTF